MQLRAVSLLGLLGFLAAGCSGAGSSSTFACEMEWPSLGLAAECQFYEAIDSTSEAALNQLREGCGPVPALDSTATITDSCPTAGNLGGCKVDVHFSGTGASDLHVTETTFFYAVDAGIATGTTSTVQEECSQMSGTFIPAP